MNPFIAAWLLAEGIIIYRSVKKNSAPPSPGALLFSSGLFVALDLLGSSSKVRPLAVTLAWGFDIAALMNLWGTGGPKGPATADKHWPPPLASDTEVFPSSNKTQQSQAPSSTTPGTTAPPKIINL